MLAGLAVLRRTLHERAIGFIWQQARSAPPGQRLCPACGKPMRLVPAVNDPKAPALDVCPACQMIWFDTDEYDALPKAPPTPAAKEQLSPQAREAAAMLTLKSLQDRYAMEEAADDARNWD